MRCSECHKIMQKLPNTFVCINKECPKAGLLVDREKCVLSKRSICPSGYTLPVNCDMCDEFTLECYHVNGKHLEDKMICTCGEINARHCPVHSEQPTGDVTKL